MTDAELDAMVALGEGITPGPWQEWKDGVGVGQYGETPIVDPVMGDTREEACANARAIAAVPDLIAALTTLRKQRDELREALGFYAEDVECDLCERFVSSGNAARQALSNMEGE